MPNPSWCSTDLLVGLPPPASVCALSPLGSAAGQPGACWAGCSPRRSAEEGEGGGGGGRERKSVV